MVENTRVSFSMTVTTAPLPEVIKLKRGKVHISSWIQRFQSLVSRPMVN